MSLFGRTLRLGATSALNGIKALQRSGVPEGKALSVLARPLFPPQNQAGLLFSSDASKNPSKAVPGKEAFDKMVKKNKVVVFMKGVPAEPKCGFSNAVVQILRMHGVDKYDSYNVLEDEGVRQGIKDYTSWPTIPQIFINGEFVGGCDIMIQMHQSGDLIKELDKAGIKSLLAESNSSAK